MNRLPLSKLLIVLTCVSACSQPQNNLEGATYIVELSTHNETIAPVDIMDCKEWISLESKNECMIGNVAKIKEYNGEIYVLENTVHNKVLVFDNTGKYERSVGKIGNASNEYITISDFALDTKNERVAILSDNSYVVLYDINGNAICKKQVDESLLSNIEYIGNGYVASTNHATYTEGENAFLLYFFDDDLNFISKCGSILDTYIPRLPLLSTTIQSNADKTYHIDVPTHSINCIDKETKEIELSYSFPFTNPASKETLSDVMTFMQKQLECDFIFDAIPFDNNLIILYLETGTLKTLIIDSDGKSIKSGTLSSVFPKSYSQTNGDILSPISPEEYLNLWDERLTIKAKDVSIEKNFLILRWKVRQ